MLFPNEFFFFVGDFWPRRCACSLLRCLLRRKVNALLLSTTPFLARFFVPFFFLFSSLSLAAMSRQAPPPAPTSIATRRLQSELREWTQNPPDGCALEKEPESLASWNIIMTPPDCARIYENEIFR